MRSALCYQVYDNKSPLLTLEVWVGRRVNGWVMWPMEALRAGGHFSFLISNVSLNHGCESSVILTHIYYRNHDDAPSTYLEMCTFTLANLL